MDFGAAMFFTDYSMAPGELARALEARGFESVWAPEHSHIPTSRKTPFPQGGELPKKYSEAMDPFVSLTAAAVTAIQQRHLFDNIQTIDTVVRSRAWRSPRRHRGAPRTRETCAPAPLRPGWP